MTYTTVHVCPMQLQIGVGGAVDNFREKKAKLIALSARRHRTRNRRF